MATLLQSAAFGVVTTDDIGGALPGAISQGSTIIVKYWQAHASGQNNPTPPNSSDPDYSFSLAASGGGDIINGIPAFVQIYFCSNAPLGLPPFIIVDSTNSTEKGMEIQEWSGILPSNSIDATANGVDNTGASADLLTGVASATNINDLLVSIGCIGDGTGLPPTPGSGFTPRVSWAGSGMSALSEDRSALSPSLPASYTADMTGAGPGIWAIALACFKLPNPIIPSPFKIGSGVPNSVMMARGFR